MFNIIALSNRRRAKGDFFVEIIDWPIEFDHSKISSCPQLKLIKKIRFKKLSFSFLNKIKKELLAIYRLI